MNRSTPGLPVYHQLPELAQTHVHPIGRRTRAHTHTHTHTAPPSLCMAVCTAPPPQGPPPRFSAPQPDLNPKWVMPSHFTQSQSQGPYRGLPSTLWPPPQPSAPVPLSPGTLLASPPAPHVSTFLPSAPPAPWLTFLPSTSHLPALFTSLSLCWPRSPECI